MSCVCGKPDNGKFMICCDSCDGWMHGECVGVNRENVPANYLCPRCNNFDTRMKAFHDQIISSVRKEMRERLQTNNLDNAAMKTFNDQIICNVRKEMREHLQEHCSKAKDDKKAEYEQAFEPFRKDMLEENAKSVQQYEEKLTALKNQLFNQQKELESFVLHKESQIQHLIEENKEKETALIVLKGKMHGKAEDDMKAEYEQALGLFRKDMLEENAKSVQQY